MTPEGYRAAVKVLGLTPCRPSHDKKTLHQGRDGLFQQVPDPEPLTADERVAVLQLLRMVLGIVMN